MFFYSFLKEQTGKICTFFLKSHKIILSLSKNNFSLHKNLFSPIEYLFSLSNSLSNPNKKLLTFTSLIGRNFSSSTKAHKKQRNSSIWSSKSSSLATSLTKKKKTLSNRADKNAWRRQQSHLFRFLFHFFFLNKNVRKMMSMVEVFCFVIVSFPSCFWLIGSIVGVGNLIITLVIMSLLTLLI